MKKIVIIIVSLVILAGVVLVGAKVARKALRTIRPENENSEMMKPSKATISATPTAMSPSATSSVEGAMNGAVKEITVTGQNFSFSPKTITVNKGDHVKLTFTNAGGIHDFNIYELNVHTKKIQGGSSDTVEFTADKTGTFQYYCSVGNHRAMGMWGTITVQ